MELCHTLFQAGKGDVPACPVFVLAHFPDGGNAGRRQDRIHEPSVLEVLGEQAVMLDDLAHASVYEHVADGHQAAGTADVLRNQVIAQIAYVVRQ